MDFFRVINTFIILFYLCAALPFIPTEMTLTVISGTYQKVLLISRKYCTNISCTLMFLGFVFESGNCVIVCVVLKLKSEKVFWDAILKFILITKLLYANSMHYRMPAVICCKRNENTRILVITSKKLHRVLQKAYYISQMSDKSWCDLYKFGKIFE